LTAVVQASPPHTRQAVLQQYVPKTTPHRHPACRCQLQAQVVSSVFLTNGLSGFPWFH
jgi:hypothetical protein